MQGRSHPAYKSIITPPTASCIRDKNMTHVAWPLCSIIVIDDGSLERMRSVANIVAFTLEIILTLTIASVFKVAHSGQ